MDWSIGIPFLVDGRKIYCKFATEKRWEKWLSHRPLIDLNGILCKELEANVVIDSWGICNSTLQFIGHVITYPRWD